MNAVEIEPTIRALADQPLNPAGVGYGFFEWFDTPAAPSKKLYKDTASNSDTGGVLQAGSTHSKACEAGQVPETLTALKDCKATQTKRNKAGFVLVSLRTDTADRGRDARCAACADTYCGGL